MCAVNDGDVGFAGYALFLLGYLGEDVAARAFIGSLADGGDDLGLIAKAALYVMGDPSPRAEVKAATQAGSFFARMACAAALGIADQDDATVRSVLVPGLSWTRPDGPDDGKGMVAAHLLALVAWERRGWAKNGADQGTISFYGTPLPAVVAPVANVPSAHEAKSCACHLGAPSRAAGLAVVTILLCLLRFHRRRHS